MTIVAATIGDYCSEYMPWWYCALFRSWTSMLVQTLVLAALVLYARRRA